MEISCAGGSIPPWRTLLLHLSNLWLKTIKWTNFPNVPTVTRQWFSGKIQLCHVNGKLAVPGVRFPLGANFCRHEVEYASITIRQSQRIPCCPSCFTMRNFTLSAAYFLSKNHYLALAPFASFLGDWRKSDVGLLDSTRQYWRGEGIVHSFPAYRAWD